MEGLIQSIQSSIKELFDEPIFIKPRGNGIFILENNNQSIAYNYRKDSPIETNVVKWFDDFWIYIQVGFKRINIEQNLSSENSISNKRPSRIDYLKRLENYHLKFGDDFFQTIITISIYQGDYNPENKRQLFRAEWDNFEGISDKHPQPHWQFYPSNVHLDENFENFEREENIPDGFLATIKKKEIDIRKFHFAMNGNWSNGFGHFHKINDKAALINWFQGLLIHIKTQLEFVK